jgi:hypothetical protein
MSRKAWLNPRKKKLIGPSIRTSKQGIQIVKGHEHEYPNKLEPLHSKNKKNKKNDNQTEKNNDEKNVKDVKKNRLATSERKNNVDDAKREMACRMGA